MVKKILARQTPPPISIVRMNQILIGLIVILALVAGYYHAVSQNWERTYRKLQVKTQLMEEELRAESNAREDTEVTTPDPL